MKYYCKLYSSQTHSKLRYRVDKTESLSVCRNADNIPLMHYHKACKGSCFGCDIAPYCYGTNGNPYADMQWDSLSENGYSWETFLSEVSAIHDTKLRLSESGEVPNSRGIIDRSALLSLASIVKANRISCFGYTHLPLSASNVSTIQTVSDSITLRVSVTASDKLPIVKSESLKYSPLIVLPSHDTLCNCDTLCRDCDKCIDDICVSFHPHAKKQKALEEYIGNQPTLLID